MKKFDLRVNHAKKVVVVSKAFDKAASRFDSEAYNIRKRVLEENPGYSIIVKPSSKKNFENMLTAKDIYYYVEKHSGKDSEEMQELLTLRGVSLKDAESVFEVEDAASFPKIKAWFFACYPDIGKKTANRQKQIDDIIKKATERTEAAKNAASA